MKHNPGWFKKGKESLWKGEKLPKEWAEKAAEGRRKSGMYKKPWNKGKKCPGVGGRKPGGTPWNKGKTGVMPTPHNKGTGLGTPLGHDIRRSIKYKEWRTAVFERDNYTCQSCGERGVVFHADHIYPFSKICLEEGITSIDDSNGCVRLWQVSNGRTLCVSCHRKTDTYAGKQQTNLYKFPRK